MKKIISIIIILSFYTVNSLYSQEAYYELDITGHVGYAGKCGSRGIQSIELEYESGPDIYFVPGRKYHKRDIKTPTVRFYESDKINRIHFTTNRRGSEPRCRSKRRSFYVKLINDETCTNFTFDFQDFPSAVGLGNAMIDPVSSDSRVSGNANILIKPIVKLKQPGVDNNFGSEDFLNIPAIRGINDRYFNWEFAFSPGGPYKSLPSYTSQKNFLRVKGKDFLDPVRDHGKTIYFRVNTSCNNSVSNTISYRFFRSAPYIISSKPIETSCYDLEDGGVILKFNRALSTGELLSITSTNSNFPGKYVNLTKASFDRNNSILIKGLKEGRYPIQILGFYRRFNTFVEGVKYTKNAIIKKPAPVEFSLSKIDVFCHGGQDGTIKIKAKGGQNRERYKYLLKKEGDRSPIKDSDWILFTNRGRFPKYEATHVIRGVNKGNYDIQIKDANGCIAKKVIRDTRGTIIGLRGEEKKRIEIKEPKKPLKVDFVFKKEPTGFGFSDGEITAHITGGTPLTNRKYNYTWKYEKNGFVKTWTSFVDEIVPGEEGWFLTLKNGIDGNYSLTVTDANYNIATNKESCTIVKAINKLIEPEKLSIVLRQTEVISCNATNTFGNVSNDGELRVEAKGGVIFSPLIDGKYKYKYIWKKKDISGNYQIILGENKPVLTNLDAGEYAVNIEDANKVVVGTYVNNVLVKVKDAIHNLKEPDLLKITYKKQDVFCYKGIDGSIDVSITGGTGNYTVLWSTKETTEDISNLSAGTYIIKVIDKKGCEAQKTIKIDEPKAPLKIAYKFFEPTFSGATNGWVEATITGGTPLATNEYNFIWKDSKGNDLKSKVTSLVATDKYVLTLNGIGKDIYKLLIQDKNYSAAIDKGNCTIIKSEYSIDDPEPLIAKVNVKKNISCNSKNIGNEYSDGEIEIIVTGGVRLQPKDNKGLPYYYTWKKEITPGVWNILTAQTTNIARGLNEGNYSVNIKDSNGIVLGEYKNNILTVPKDIKQEIKEPEALKLTFKKQDVYCYEGNDAWINVSVQGGAKPYIIEWDTGSNVSTISDLYEGVYEVKVTDKNGCEIKESVKINQPKNPIEINYIEFSTPIKGKESNGSITAIVTGGTAFLDKSYTYYWQNEKGDILNYKTVTSSIGGNFKIKLNNIPKGKYVLTIEDANYTKATTKKGCTFIEKEFILYDPIEAVITVETPISCNQNNTFYNPFSDGSLKVKVTGGLPFSTGKPYKYFWKKENDLGIYEDLVINNKMISNVSEGNYAINVEDSRGLVIGEYKNLNLVRTIDKLFTFNEPDLLEVSLKSTEISCDLGNNGTATVTISGGIKPYFVEWSNGNTGVTATNLVAGNYVVFVTDARGCKATGNISLTPPGGLKVDIITEKAPTCFKGDDGIIKLNISGGTAPYIYSWNTGETTPTISNLKEGKYIFSLIDGKGCKTFLEIELKDPQKLSIDLGEDKTICNNQSYSLDGSIEDTKATYVWFSDNGFTSTNSKITIKEGGTYTVTATSSNGCTATDSVIIFKNNNDIDADFLMSSQGYVNEEIVIFNVSNPISESFEWVLPKEAIIVEDKGNSIIVKLSKEATYEIGLRSKQGDCSQELFKPIVIEEFKNLSSSGDASSPFIESFTISPNPNSGIFSTNVKLVEPSEISIRIFNMQGEFMIKHNTSDILEEHKSAFNIKLSSGTYIVVLETAKETRVKRMIVN